MAAFQVFWDRQKNVIMIDSVEGRTENTEICVLSMARTRSLRTDRIAVSFE